MKSLLDRDLISLLEIPNKVHFATIILLIMQLIDVLSKEKNPSRSSFSSVVELFCSKDSKLATSGSTLEDRKLIVSYLS